MNVRLLLVDDDEDDALLFRRALERTQPAEAAFEVVHARDVKEARRLLREGGFDVAVLDYRMPEVTGLEFLQEIVPAHPKLPVIMCTGSGDERTAARAMKERAQDYLLKSDVSRIPLARLLLDAIASKRKEIAEAEETRRIAQRARLDDLTGLDRQLHILKYLESSVERCRKERQPLSCALVDVDFLKTINDTFGHPFGSFTLQVVASILRDALEPGARAGRYGGDEFLVVCPGKSADETVGWAERICRVAAGTLIDDGRVRTVTTLSVGVAESSASDEDGADELLRKTDRALYAAKSAGRNRVMPYGEPPAKLHAPAGPPRRKQTGLEAPELLFGSIAVGRGWLREEELRECLREQGRSHELIGQILMRRGRLNALQLQEVLEEQRHRVREFTASLVGQRKELADELRRARSVQEKLMPAVLPRIAGLDLAGECVPAGMVGGDFYDVWRVGERAIDVAVGDVSGHGVASAMIMAMMNGMIRALLPTAPAPREVLRQLNRLFERQHLSNSFVGLAYVRLDLAAGRATCFAAGHPPPLIVGKDGRVRALGASGPAIGIVGEEAFLGALAEETLDLSGVRRLFLYTDGVTESRDGSGRMLEESGLASLVRELDRRGGSAEAVRTLSGRLRERSAARGLEDDFTLFCATLD